MGEGGEEGKDEEGWERRKKIGRAPLLRDLFRERGGGSKGGSEGRGLSPAFVEILFHPPLVEF